MAGGGCAVFAKCDKAGSIPYFTKHLESHPNDFEALKWRGRAYSIIGKLPEAIKDFRTAERNCPPPYNLLAKSELAHCFGSREEKEQILHGITKQYPLCGEAWSEIGQCRQSEGKYNQALQLLTKSIDLGNSSGEEEKSWHYWSKDGVGEINFLKGDLETSEKYYSSAVKSCPSFTKAHLGIGKCNVLTGNLEKAKRSYLKAKDLNPNITHWETFPEFEDYVWSLVVDDANEDTQEREAGGVAVLSHEFRQMNTSSRGGGNGAENGRPPSGGNGAENGGLPSGGNRGGNGSNGDDDTVWKKFKASKPITAKCTRTNRIFYQVGDSEFWLTRDKARHAGVFFKLFIEKGSTFDFVGSLPITIFKNTVYNDSRKLNLVLDKGAELCDFDIVPNKHESHAGEKVKRNDLSYGPTKKKK